MLTTIFYRSFSKDILLYMSSRLSKIRSVHTHIMPRTVSFGWIFRKVLLKHSTTVQQRKARVFETTLVLQLVPKNSSQPKMTSFGKNQSFSEFCPAKIAQISENWQKIKDLFYLQNPVEVVKMVNIVTFSVVIINVWRLHLRDFVWWCCSAVVWLKNYQKVAKNYKISEYFFQNLEKHTKITRQIMDLRAILSLFLLLFGARFVNSEEFQIDCKEICLQETIYMKNSCDKR